MTLGLYYTYMSYEDLHNGRYYIGSRKCPEDKDPWTDEYLGSFTDKTFSPTGKLILCTFNNREKVLEEEIYLHEKYNVDKNPSFANRSKLTSTKFSYDLTGSEWYYSPEAEEQRMYKGGGYNP